LPYKNPADQKAYQAAYNKKRRSTAPSAKKKLKLKGVPISTADDLKNIISAAIYELVNTPMEPAQRGRTLAQLVTVAIRLQEVCDLELRMTEVENRLGLTATQWR
jgi:hypothetical protein